MLHEIVQTSRCGGFWCLSIIGKKAYGLWIESNTLATVDKYGLSTGKIDDPNYPRIFNVGCRGSGVYNKTKNKDAYQVWYNIMSRCYNYKAKDFKYYGKRGVEVCKHWHNFQNFAGWFYSNRVQDYDIDKELFGNGVLYSADTCCFIPRRLNLLLSSLNKGIIKDNTSGKYIVKLSHPEGRVEYFGKYDNKSEAASVAKCAQIKRLKDIADDMLCKNLITLEIYSKIEEITCTNQN